MIPVTKATTVVPSWDRIWIHTSDDDKTTLEKLPITARHVRELMFGQLTCFGHVFQPEKNIQQTTIKFTKLGNIFQDEKCLQKLFVWLRGGGGFFTGEWRAVTSVRPKRCSKQLLGTHCWTLRHPAGQTSRWRRQRPAIYLNKKDEQSVSNHLWFSSENDFMIRNLEGGGWISSQDQQLYREQNWPPLP